MDGWLLNPNHQLKTVVNIQLFRGFQPSFWWCRISCINQVNLHNLDKYHLDLKNHLDDVNVPPYRASDFVRILDVVKQCTVHKDVSREEVRINNQLNVNKVR